MDAKISLGISSVIIILVVASSIFYNASLGNANNSTAGAASNVLRIGYFPNLNHAQAVIGLENGDFQKTLGNDGIIVEPHVFSAGPSVIEALFANQIDVAYIGPNPTINGHVVSDGKDLRIISGAASGGAVFVVRNDSGIKSPKDLSLIHISEPTRP